MTTEPQLHGNSTEELVIQAREAQRRRGQGRVHRIGDHVRREWQIYLMLLPTLIWLIVFLYKPMYGLQIAFKDYSVFRGIDASPWVWFEHFATLFSNDQFLRALRNTVIISFLGLIFGGCER